MTFDFLLEKSSEKLERNKSSRSFKKLDSSEEQMPIDSATIERLTNDVSDVELQPDIRENISPKKPEIDYNLISFDTKPDIVTLKGDPNSLIDLETGDVISKKPSGPEELFERFLKHKKKSVHKDTAKLGLCSTDSGKINLDIITVHVHDDDDIIKETTPGSAYVKLKKTLEEKMAEDRRRECLKRLKALEKERKEELEEYSDCEYDDEENDEDDEEEVAVAKKIIDENEEEINENK